MTRFKQALVPRDERAFQTSGAGATDACLQLLHHCMEVKARSLHPRREDLDEEDGLLLSGPREQQEEEEEEEEEEKFSSMAAPSRLEMSTSSWSDVISGPLSSAAASPLGASLFGESPFLFDDCHFLVDWDQELSWELSASAEPPNSCSPQIGSAAAATNTNITNTTTTVSGAGGLPDLDGLTGGLLFHDVLDFDLDDFSSLSENLMHAWPDEEEEDQQQQQPQKQQEKVSHIQDVTRISEARPRPLPAITIFPRVDHPPSRSLRQTPGVPPLLCPRARQPAPRHRGHVTSSSTTSSSSCFSSSSSSSSSSSTSSFTSIAAAAHSARFTSSTPCTPSTTTTTAITAITEQSQQLYGERQRRSNLASRRSREKRKQSFQRMEAEANQLRETSKRLRGLDLRLHRVLALSRQLIDQRLSVAGTAGLDHAVS